MSDKKKRSIMVYNEALKSLSDIAYQAIGLMRNGHFIEAHEKILGLWKYLEAMERQTTPERKRRK